MKKRNLLILFVALAILIIPLIIRETNNNQINQGLVLEHLRSLPYLTHTKEKVNEGEMGVVKYNPKLAFDRYNLYKNKLINMQGDIVHSWSNPNHNLGLFGVILNNGDFLISNFEGTSIAKYDWDSNIIWEKELTGHHEIALSSNNTILIPSKEMHEYNGRKVEFDLIIDLSQEGEEISRWSTYDNFDELKRFHEPSELDKPASVFIDKVDENYDYYHLNSIQVLPETSISKKDKRFQAGNWLLSFRHVNLIVILDKETKKIVWSWGPRELEGQHSPRMLDNGNILTYDNGHSNRAYTRVIELDPIKKKIVWEYKTNPPQLFFSKSEGYAQRLPNKNTLITDSDNGRVFEVTKEGEIVWEWFNPQINEEGKRITVYRMVGYPKDKIDKLLKLNKKTN